MSRRTFALGDTVRIVELAPGLSFEGSRRAVALAARVRAAALDGVRDVVVTGASVAIHVDPLRIADAGLDAFLGEAGDEAEAVVAPDPEPIVVPVRYGGEDGPDIVQVAALCGCSVDELIARHAARTYHVSMMGFVPGFAYLWPLDERLQLPRRESPRTHVPAGSVAIAGPYTAVYPSATPGGWHLIGRTDVVLVDLSRPEPFLFDVGRTVRFVPR